MKTIVVGYDDTAPAKRALERAASLAKAFDSKLIVTSVAPAMTGASGRGLGGIDPTDSPADHIAELATARTYLQGQDLHAQYVAAVGHPGQSIAELATERGADLIVVGTREPSLLRRLVGDSVSETVAHHVHCDVLIVH